mgnify:FL=1
MRKEMMKINGLSKAERLLWFGPQNAVSTAYIKTVREHFEGRKVYDVNPYVEVYRFRDNLYGLFNQNCDGAGDVWMWLTLGSEKCFLIDTGYGLGDMKGLVREIAGDREIIVANTHDHFDHAFGNCRFDRVYCHEALVPLLKDQNEHMWDYLFYKDTGENIWLKFDREDLPEFRPYEICGVPDGYKWDLGGGYEIELINCHGHGGAGSAMYLDRQNRILFAGDNICSDISGCGNISYPLKDCSLYKFRNNLRRIIDTKIDDIDWVFPNHLMTDLENRILYDMLDTLDKILEDPEHNYDYKIESRSTSNPDAPVRVRYAKYIPGFSIIAYSISESEPVIQSAAISALTK